MKTRTRSGKTRKIFDAFAPFFTTIGDAKTCPLHFVTKIITHNAKKFVISKTR